MIQEDVILKIRKLLALSKSPNEFEAASALSKAQELLDKSSLSLSEVEDFKISDIEPFLVASKSRYPYWEQLLFTRLAKESDLFPYSELRDRKVSLWVVGREQDIEVYGYFLNFLKRTILALSDKAIFRERKSVRQWDRRKAFKFRNSFGVGAVTKICERMHALREKRLDSNGACKALIVVKNKEVEDWVSENLATTRRNRTMDLSRRGYIKGYLAGSDVSLREGMTNLSRSQIKG